MNQKWCFLVHPRPWLPAYYSTDKSVEMETPLIFLNPQSSSFYTLTEYQWLHLFLEQRKLSFLSFPLEQAQSSVSLTHPAQMLLHYWPSAIALLTAKSLSSGSVGSKKLTRIWQGCSLQPHTSLLLPLWQHGREMKNRHPFDSAPASSPDLQAESWLSAWQALGEPGCFCSSSVLLAVASDVGLEETLK